jgi:hypothetical protein
LKKERILAKVGVLVMGITFKEDVADIRNSKVVDFGTRAGRLFYQRGRHDPYASVEMKKEYDIELLRDAKGVYDAIVMAVGHKEYTWEYLQKVTHDQVHEKLVFDIKAYCVNPSKIITGVFDEYHSEKKLSKVNREIFFNTISSVASILVSSLVLFYLYRVANHQIGLEQIGLWSIVMTVTSSGPLAPLDFQAVF